MAEGVEEATALIAVADELIGRDEEEEEGKEEDEGAEEDVTIVLVAEGETEATDEGADEVEAVVEARGAEEVVIVVESVETAAEG